MKLTWKVDPPPSGRWKSFTKRGWPTAEWPDGSIAALIYCADEYIPRLVKRANMLLWSYGYFNIIFPTLVTQGYRSVTS